MPGTLLVSRKEYLSLTPLLLNMCFGVSSIHSAWELLRNAEA